MTPEEKRDWHRLIKDNFTVDYRDKVHSNELLTRLDLFNYSEPVVMIFRGTDQSMTALKAL